MKSVCFLCPFFYSTVTPFLQGGLPRKANVTGSPSVTLCVLVKPKLRCQANHSSSNSYQVQELLMSSYGPFIRFFGWPVQILAAESEI